MTIPSTHEELQAEINRLRQGLAEAERDYQTQLLLNRLLQMSLQEMSLSGMLEGFLDRLNSSRWLALRPTGIALLVKEDPGLLVMKAHCGLPDSLIASCARVAGGECLCRKTALTGKVMFADCPDCPDGRREGRPAGMAAHGCYCIPVVSAAEKVLGVFCLPMKGGCRGDQRVEEVLVAAAGMAAAVIERRQTEEARQEIEEQLRRQRDFLHTAIEAFPRPFYVIDVQSHAVVLANSAANFGDLSGGPTCYSLTHGRKEPCKGEHPCPLEEIKRTRRPVTVEHIHHDRDGRAQNIEVHGYPVFGEQGNVVQVIEACLDVTEFRITETELRESRQRYQRIIEAVTDYVYTVQIENGQPVKTFHNPASVAVTGYSPGDFAADPCLWLMMVVEEDRATVQEQVALVHQGRDVKEIEYRIIRKDGELRWVSNTFVLNRDPQGRLLSYDGIVKDISRRKQIEEERTQLESRLQQAQKMEAIGTLAGGIAHDFNNILSPIFGYSEMIMADTPVGGETYYRLNEILTAAKRAKALVKQILTFSRQGALERRPMQIHFVVSEALKLLRASIPATIEIRLNIQKSGIILADIAQMHQVIMNLCTFAYQAMREKGGLLEVSLAAVQISPGELTGSPEPVPGPYVELRVRDNGCGMERAVRERIFEPYFSLPFKERGEGAGLGLSVVHGIVKNHGGHIVVDSEPGQGTTFSVYLPCIETIGAVPEVESMAPVPGGSEHILVVDDEEHIVRMARQMLEKLGYKVTVRTSSVEGLEAFQAQPENFDLVITDMTMPNMTGMVLAQKLMAIRPGLPIILCTGYSGLINKEKARAAGIREFIMKPYVKRQIAETIRRALAKQEQEES